MYICRCSSTLPIYVGGVIRKIADRKYKRVPDDVEEAEGTLMSSGLIAGGAFVGVLGAFLHFVPGMHLMMKTPDFQWQSLSDTNICNSCGTLIGSAFLPSEL